MVLVFKKSIVITLFTSSSPHSTQNRKTRSIHTSSITSIKPRIGEGYPPFTNISNPIYNKQDFEPNIVMGILSPQYPPLLQKTLKAKKTVVARPANPPLIPGKAAAPSYFSGFLLSGVSSDGASCVSSGEDGESFSDSGEDGDSLFVDVSESGAS